MNDERAPKNATEMLADLCDSLQGPEEDVRDIPMEQVLKELKRAKLDSDPIVARVRGQLADAKAAALFRPSGHAKFLSWTMSRLGSLLK